MTGGTADSHSYNAPESAGAVVLDNGERRGDLVDFKSACEALLRKKAIQRALNRPKGGPHRPGGGNAA
jgi:hypothetical protein